MNTESFCSFLRSIRDEHISRREFARIFPWHENTLKGYDKDRLPDVDYLYAVHQVSDYPFFELVEKRLLVGVLKLKAEDIKFNLKSSSTVSVESLSNTYKASDTAMEPTLLNGGEYVVDMNDRFLSEGRLYAIKIRHNVTVRRVQFDLSNRILLTADNKNFASLTMTADDRDKLEVIGRVTYVTNPV